MSSSEPVEIVTIVGSHTPSVILPRGETRTVAMTPRIRKLIDRGFVVVTASYTVPAPVTVTPALPEHDETFTVTPAMTATKAAWQEFLTGQGIAWEHGDTKAELIGRWDTH